jgi:hypothetical protein
MFALVPKIEMAARTHFGNQRKRESRLLSVSSSSWEIPFAEMNPIKRINPISAIAPGHNKAYLWGTADPMSI